MLQRVEFHARLWNATSPSTPVPRPNERYVSEDPSTDAPAVEKANKGSLAATMRSVLSHTFLWSPAWPRRREPKSPGP
jgi:hypothetical protein